jgi:agmatinase
VSTGRAEQVELQKQLYRARSENEVGERWREALRRISDARVLLLGVPSDVGAGFLRGANMGPSGIRTALLAARPDYPDWLAAKGIVDIGDVFVVPQLLHDEMLSADQLERSRRALYPDVPERGALPVSPLSITERVLDLVYAMRPDVRVFVFGGDHSVAWPVSAALARQNKEGLAIVQFDAHTDLLEERLGVRYCFATWSRHASRLLEAPNRMVQVGLRASGHDRAHWERETGVVQVWADECNTDPAAAEARIVAHLERVGARRLYVSNDIDGTDASMADATGTPEPGGLTPTFVESVIRRLGAVFEIVAGDIMEVAPPLARSLGGADRTLETSARYVMATLESI